MLMEWTEFVDFIWARAQELVQTEFDQVRYADVGTAYLLSIALGLAAMLTVARMTLTARTHSRHHSGHLVDPKFHRGRVVKLLYNAPKLLLALAVAGVAIALSDPFLTATEEVTGDVESRVRIDLVDTSLSMAWEFRETGQSRAEAAREAHLRFLDMRREKNDRVSLWLFSSYPYMVDDFVIDDEMYFFQVMDAPYATVKILAPEPGTSLGEYFIPLDKVRIIPNEGSTDIVQALRAVTKHFDRDAATVEGFGDQHRALLIVTDADVDVIPRAELAQLEERNIVPYLIYINAGGVAAEASNARDVPELIEGIREFGGDYFDVTDQDSLDRAYEAIDEQEAVRVEVSHRAQRVPIYARFLLLSMVFLVVAIPAGFVAELLWGTHP
jgi:hypothetical protein